MTLLCDNAELGILMLIILLDPIFIPHIFALALVVAKNLPSICPGQALSFPVLEKLFASAGLTERYSFVVVNLLLIAFAPPARSPLVTPAANVPNTVGVLPLTSSVAACAPAPIAPLTMPVATAPIPGHAAVIAPVNAPDAAETPTSDQFIPTR